MPPPPPPDYRYGITKWNIWDDVFIFPIRWSEHLLTVNLNLDQSNAGSSASGSGHMSTTNEPEHNDEENNGEGEDWEGETVVDNE